MRTVPDWSIQTAWWLSGIFATGAVWYFLGANSFVFAGVSAAVAVALAGLAITLHRKKDAAERIAEGPAVTSSLQSSAHRSGGSRKHHATPIPGRHVGNVNTNERNGSAIRDAIMSRLPDATIVQVVPTATINFGTGLDATQKFQYQVSFNSNRTVAEEEFASAVGSLIVDLNSYSVSGDA